MVGQDTLLSFSSREVWYPEHHSMFELIIGLKTHLFAEETASFEVDSLRTSGDFISSHICWQILLVTHH